MEHIMSLLEKLIKIQALVDHSSSEGERQAASLAMERLLKRQEQQPIEFGSKEDDAVISGEIGSVHDAQ
jgi:hypothetical protein